MAWTPGVLSVLAFGAAGILAVLAGIGWRRQESEATSFTVLMVAVLLWASVYGVQLGFTTGAEQLPWQRATIAISGTVPVSLLRFSQQYAGTHGRLTGRVQNVLAGEAVVFAGLALTNPVHGLVWVEAGLRSGSTSPALVLEFGGGYFVHIVIAYTVVAAALWTILSVYFRSSSVYRRQSALLLAGVLPAFGAHVLYTVGMGPIAGLDLTPFAFTVTGVTWGLALFHFDLLERTPVAHRRAIELTGDGILVVDTDGTIVDSNRVARQLFSLTEVGKAHISSITDETDIQHLDETSITGEHDGTQRVYDIHVTDLTDDVGLHAGSLVVLRDVTDRDAYQQRLEVTNRVLRHNLRNEMNVILGHADLLETTVPTSTQREHAKTIRRTAEDLVSLSEKARDLVELKAARRSDGVVVDVDAVLTPLLAEFREEYPTVSVTVECPDDACVRTTSKQALTIALRNLLENAAEHNDTASLAVDIAVSVDGQRTRIAISDTGSGLPEMEQRVLHADSESSLQHSDGLGLWLTYWIVSISGGEIAVEAADSDGTTVTMTLPGDDPPADRNTTSEQSV